MDRCGWWWRRTLCYFVIITPISVPADSLCRPTGLVGSEAMGWCCSVSSTLSPWETIQYWTLCSDRRTIWVPSGEISPEVGLLSGRCKSGRWIVCKCTTWVLFHWSCGNRPTWRWWLVWLCTMYTSPCWSTITVSKPWDHLEFKMLIYFFNYSLRLMN